MHKKESLVQFYLKCNRSKRTWYNTIIIVNFYTFSSRIAMGHLMKIYILEQNLMLKLKVMT